MATNMVRARVKVRGSRPLLQHAFTEAAIPLETQERTGVAGNDPVEWKRTCMVTEEGQLYLKAANVFASIRDGSKHTKKGKGSVQPFVCATLQVEEAVILLNRRLPKEGEPTRDPTKPVYVDVCGVKNPATKGRNVRYRLAASPGWECTFTLLWDRTIVSREVMRAVLRDTSVLVGIGDGRAVGNGRFAIVSYEELADAEEATTAGNLEEAQEDRVVKGRKKVRQVPQAAEANGVPH